MVEFITGAQEVRATYVLSIITAKYTIFSFKITNIYEVVKYKIVKR